MMQPLQTHAVGNEMSTERWFDVGSSNHTNAAAAGAEATRRALVGTDPKLVIVFCSPAYPLREVAESVAEVVPDVPMIGCSTSGEIATGQAGEQSVTVSILGGGFVVATACANGASSDQFGAGAGAASAVAELPERDHAVLLVLADGLAGNQQDVVRGAYAEVGAGVPLVGGCAGDDSAMVKTLQIHDGAVYEDSVVAAAIGSDAPFGIGVRHGWKPVGVPMLVTRSDTTTIFELDDSPALDRYVECSGADAGLGNDPLAFTQFAITHPLGLRRRSTEEVRFISGGDPVRRTLSTIADVPQGSLVWLMEGDAESVLCGTRASCDEALAELEGHEPIGLLVFDCIARRNVLGPTGVAAEMSAISQMVPTVPTAGFYTYGEIARTRGVRGFHNQTLVTLALS